MKRRTLIRRMGAAGVATTLAGRTAAESSELSLGVDRDIDVSSVSGRVPLEQLLESQDLARVPDRFDPQEVTIHVDEDADDISLDSCCVYCSKWPNVCDCSCCTLSRCACPDEFC